jgi:hypothetical protein
LRAFVRDGVDEWPGLFVERSLSAPSSKIWIPQEQWPIPEEGVRDIEATDWIAAQEGKGRYSIAGQPIPWTAFLGTRAPNPASFDVMGAWLDDKAQVFIDPDKADRSQRLSAFGWVDPHNSPAGRIVIASPIKPPPFPLPPYRRFNL